MKFTFSKDFRESNYRACLKEIGVLIDRLRIDSGCSIKPLMGSVHIGHSALKGVCLAR